MKGEVNNLNENKGPIEYEEMDMPTEEIKDKYDLKIFNDLKGNIDFKNI